MDVLTCARRIVQGVYNKEKNVYVTTLYHRIGIFLKYVWPELVYSKLVKQAKKERQREAAN